MRRGMIYAALIGCCLQGCQGKGFVIDGRISDGGEGMYVYLTDINQQVKYDSVRIKDGRFRFKGELPFPEIRCLTLYKDPNDRISWKNIVSLPVFVENANITVAAPYEKLPTKLNDEVASEVQVEGSASHEVYQVYRKGLLPLKQEDGKNFDAYRMAYYYPEKDAHGNVDVCRAFKAAQKQSESRRAIYEYQLDFIRRYPNSPVSLYVGSVLAPERYGRHEIARIMDLYSPEIRETEAGRLLEGKLNDKPIYVGDRFIDAIALNTDLQEVKVGDWIEPGKYTLLEFWASWCGPCRADIPHLKRAYGLYHEKGFNIVSISIDENKEDWRKAVDKEQMPWEQLCDKNREECVSGVYGVTGVPSGFLIDPEGRVVLLNARGGWLDSKLAELYGNLFE